MVSENEQRSPVGPAKDNVDGTFGHVDLADQFTRRVVDEDLAVGNVDISLRINGDAFAAALRKRLQVCQRAVGGDARAVSAIFR